MGRLSLLALGVIGTLNLLGVSAQTAPACVETCTNDVRNKFADLACPDASAAPCFCTNPAFSTAILQCSQAQCGGTVDNIYTYLSTHFCAGQALPPPNGAAVPSSSTSQIPTPSETVTPSTPPTPTPTPSTPATEAVTTSTNTVPTTTPAVTSASTESTTSGAATAETGSSTSSSPPSSTSGSAASATSSGDAAGGSTSSGLSQAAIAGIGVGIGVVVLAVAGIVILMLLRGRNRKVGKAGDNMDISRPLPGSGRTYPEREAPAAFRNDRDHSMEKFGNDLEMTSHRYEDMVPRTQPRNLV